MTNNPGNPENPETNASDEARKKRNAELFGDLDDEELAETPETIKAERDALRQQLSDTATRFGKLQQDNLSLAKQLADQSKEAADILARTKKQAQEQSAFALEKFVKDILPFVDNMELGLKTVSKEQRAADPKFDKHVQGMEKTLNQLTAVFNKYGVKAIDPKGEAFDPNKHEAIAQDNHAEAETDTVVDVAQKGYELNGRVIRPAKVTVKT